MNPTAAALADFIAAFILMALSLAFVIFLFNLMLPLFGREPLDYLFTGSAIIIGRYALHGIIRLHFDNKEIFKD